MSATKRRSRKGDEADDLELGSEWTCMLSKLKATEPDLRMWPLSDLLSCEFDDQGERIPVKLAFECPASVLQEIEDSRAVTFYGGRHLGQEPCGLELYGLQKGKGCDPRMNREEKSIVADFYRNTDNWAMNLLLFSPD
jgi:hypothetical protein